MEIKQLPPKTFAGLHQEVGRVDSIDMDISIGLQNGCIIFFRKGKTYLIPVVSLVEDVVEFIEIQKV